MTKLQSTAVAAGLAVAALAAIFSRFFGPFSAETTLGSAAPNPGYAGAAALMIGGLGLIARRRG